LVYLSQVKGIAMLSNQDIIRNLRSGACDVPDGVVRKTRRRVEAHLRNSKDPRLILGLARVFGIQPFHEKGEEHDSDRHEAEDRQ
jgi:hypothetical protein